jgi:catechol 2,3-dioxygenase-like lactoylglutathione lyase family enzyme
LPRASALGFAPVASSCTSVWTTTSGPPRKGHPGILVNDLDEVVGRLRARGQSTEWDGNFPGFRRVYAHDPFGNRLEFLQPSP